MNSRNITFVLMLYFNSVICITVKDFALYGSEHGDTQAPTNDDGSTSPIPVSSLFPFFNQQHNSLTVSFESKIARLFKILFIYTIYVHCRKYITFICTSFRNR